MSLLRFAFVQVLLATTAVIPRLFAGAQSVAAMLAFQPALSDPAVDVLSIKLYAPCKLSAWWLAFGGQGQLGS